MAISAKLAIWRRLKSLTTTRRRDTSLSIKVAGVRTIGSPPSIGVRARDVAIISNIALAARRRDLPDSTRCKISCAHATRDAKLCLAEFFEDGRATIFVLRTKSWTRTHRTYWPILQQRARNKSRSRHKHRRRIWNRKRKIVRI